MTSEEQQIQYYERKYRETEQKMYRLVNQMYFNEASDDSFAKLSALEEQSDKYRLKILRLRGIA